MNDIQFVLWVASNSEFITSPLLCTRNQMGKVSPNVEEPFSRRRTYTWIRTHFSHNAVIV